MSDELRLIVNVFPFSEQGNDKEIEYVLKMIVSKEMYISALVEQIIMQSDPTVDYTKYGFVLASSNKWLQGTNTVSHYNLKDGDVLNLLYKRKKIKVKTLDGSIRTVLIDETLTVGTIVEGICARLGIRNYDEYALMLEGVPDDNNNKGSAPNSNVMGDTTNWLRSGRLLREQNAFDAKYIVLKRRFFFNHDNVDISDPLELNLLYSQVQLQIRNGQSPCTLPVACMFAATQLQVEMGDYNSEKYKHFDIHPKNLIPVDYAKHKDIKKMIAAEHAKLVGISNIEAKSRYLKLFKSLPVSGATFFSAEIIESNKKSIPCFLGVSRTKMIVIDYENRKVVTEWDLHHMRRWSVIYNTLTIDLGDYADKYIRFKCADSELISDLVFGYINILLKRHKLKNYKKSNRSKIAKNQAGAIYRPNFKRNTGEFSHDDMSDNSSIFSSNSVNGDTKKRRVDSTMGPNIDGLDDVADVNSPEAFDKRQFDACISSVIEYVKSTNMIFKNSRLTRSIADGATGPGNGSLSRGEMPQHSDIPFSFIADSRTIETDMEAMVLNIPKITINSVLHRFDRNMADVNLIKDDINSLIHSQASLVRSLDSIVNSSNSNDLIPTEALHKDVDVLFSCVQGFTDKLKNITIDKFPIDEYSSLVNKLANCTSGIMKVLNNRSVDQDSLKRITDMSHLVNDKKANLIESLLEALDAIPGEVDDESRKKIADQVKIFDFVSSVNVAFVPALSVINENYCVGEYLKECFKNDTSNVKSIIANLESKEVNPGVLDRVRKLTDEFLDSYFNCCYMMNCVGKDSKESQLHQFRTICTCLDSLLSDDITVAEFAERMNELSLSTMNLFNESSFLGIADDDEDRSSKILKARKLVGTSYADVMACAREYASNMSDSTLRRDLVNSISQLKTVMQNTMDSGLRSCVFYDVYIATKDLSYALNYLVSYSKTSLIPRYASKDYPELHNEILDYTASQANTYSALKLYRDQPSSHASRLYLVKSSKALADKSVSLITAATDLAVTCVDPNIKGLIQKSADECARVLAILQSALSKMHNYPVKIELSNIHEQLNVHIEDLLLARDKVSELVNLESYDLSTALNDFENSVKYARVSGGQLMSDLNNQLLAESTSTIGHMVNVLQCISFATLGICSTTEDVSKRLKNINTIVSFAELVREIVIDMEDKVDDTDVCPSIRSKYSLPLKDALRKLSNVTSTREKLVDAYELSRMIMDVDDLLTFDNSKYISLTPREITEEIISSAQTLSETVKSLSVSINESDEVQKTAYQKLYDDFKRFTDISFQYVNNDSESSFVKSIVNDTVNSFNSLVGTMIDRDSNELDPKIERGLRYYTTSVDDSLQKCIVVLKRDSDKAPNLLLDYKELDYPLKRAFDILSDNISQNDIIDKVDDSIENADLSINDNNNMYLLFINGQKKIKDHIANINKSLKENNFSSIELENDISNVGSVVADLSTRMKNYITSVERTSGAETRLQTMGDGALDVEVIKETSNFLNQIVLQLDESSVEKLIADGRNVANSCRGLHYMCMDVAQKVRNNDADTDLANSYCKTLSSNIIAIEECLRKLDEDPNDNESKIALKDNISKVNSFVNDLYGFARTPRISVNANGANSKTNVTEDKLFNFMCRYRICYKKYIDLINDHAENPSPETAKLINETSNELISLIEEVSYEFSDFPPIVGEFDMLRERFTTVEERYNKLCEENNKAIAEGQDISQSELIDNLENDLIDLTSSHNNHHDYYGILDPNIVHGGQNGVDRQTLFKNLSSNNKAGVIELIKLSDIIKACDAIVECTSLNKADVLDEVRNLSKLYDSICANPSLFSQDKTPQGKNVGSLISKEDIEKFRAHVNELLLSCRNRIASVNNAKFAADGSREELDMSDCYEKLNALKDIYSKIVDLVLDNYSENKEKKDVLNSAIQIMSSKCDATSPSIEKEVGKDEQAQFNQSVVTDTDDSDSFKNSSHIAEFNNFKKHLDKFTSVTAKLGNKASSEPETVRKLTSTLFKLYAEFNNDYGNIIRVSQSYDNKTNANNLSKNIGFNLFRLLDIQKSRDDGLIDDIRVVDEIYNTTIEILKYMDDFYKGFKTYIRFINTGEELTNNIDDSLNVLNEKLDTCKQGMLSNVNYYEDFDKYKATIMEKSIKLVEDINSFLDTIKSNSPANVTKKAAEIFNIITETTDASVKYAASRTPLNKDEQMSILNNSIKLMESFREQLSASLDYVHVRISSPDMNISGRQRRCEELTCKTLQATKDLFSSVNVSDTKMDTDEVCTLIKNTNEFISKQLEIVKQNTDVPQPTFSSAAALTGALNSSKELSNIIPELIQKLTDVDSLNSSSYAPIVNKFTTEVEYLLKSSSVASRIANDKEAGSSNILDEAIAFCNSSLDILDVVSDVVSGKCDNDDKLLDATKNFNLTISRVAKCAENGIKSQTDEELSHPMNVAEQELWTVRDTIKGVYKQFNNSEINCKDSIDVGGNSINDKSFFGDMNYEIKNIVLASLSILREVHSAYRNSLHEESAHGNEEDESHFKKGVTKYSPLVALARKLSFMTVNLCHQSTTLGIEAADVYDVIATCRSIVNVLKNTSSKAMQVIDNDSKLCARISDASKLAMRSLENIISLCSSSLTLDKAEDIISSSILGDNAQNFCVRNQLRDAHDAFPINIRSEGIVRERLEEIDARMKIIKIEKDLEDARVGLGKARRRLYTKEKMQKLPPVF